MSGPTETSKLWDKYHYTDYLYYSCGAIGPDEHAERIAAIREEMREVELDGC